MEILVYLFILVAVMGLLLSKLGVMLIALFTAAFCHFAIKAFKHPWYSFPGDGTDSVLDSEKES